MPLNAIPKVYSLGHRHTQGILEGEIRIQEKIDGSQFSFCFTSGDVPMLECRSKGTVMLSGNPGMFKQAVDSVQQMAENGQLPSGYVFHCEYLAKPKHNVLTYACIPAGHLVLFDVRNAAGEYLPDEVNTWATVLGIQPVPTLYKGSEGASVEFSNIMLGQSILGGTQMEGIVIKNYAKPHPESESGFAPMTAKVVSDKFKEKHTNKMPSPKAKQNEFVPGIVARYRTEARWLKAIQHLKESNSLVNGPEDIGPLLKEIEQDVLVEEGDDIAQICLLAHWKEIARGLTGGFPEYYKKLLAGGPSIWQEQQMNTNE